MPLRGTGSKQGKTHPFSFRQHYSLPLVALIGIAGKNKIRFAESMLQHHKAYSKEAGGGGGQFAVEIRPQTILCLNLVFATFSLCDLGQFTERL